MPTEADNVINHEEADRSKEKFARKSESRRKKRMREKGSQTDDEALSDSEQPLIFNHGTPKTVITILGGLITR